MTAGCVVYLERTIVRRSLCPGEREENILSEEKELTAEEKPLRGKPKGRNYAFYSHKECEYFPCHQTDDPDNFNCLFCYCPLYALGDRCGGKFRYNKKGIKDCTPCDIPHRRENYDYIKSRFKDILEMVKKD